MQAGTPGRKTLPHLSPREMHNQSIILYVTQVVAQRRPLLDRSQVHAVLLQSWQRAHGWIVGRYVLMPDHLHFFCAPATHPALPFSRWHFYWRWEASRHWPFPLEKPVWQKDFLDRQLRAGDSYRAKWSYVRENPVRAGLVEFPDSWPWQGEIHSLPWHEAS